MMHGQTQIKFTELYLYALVTSELDTGGWITPLTGRFTPNKEPRYRMYFEK